ncbi:MAG: SPOR domain-containing protein [Thermoanaerobaculia bacterium]
MPEPRTHYQLSFTARQAMVFFVVCLLVLGLSFFFGLMAGLSGRPDDSAGPGQPPTTPPEAAPAPVAGEAVAAPEEGSSPESAGRLEEPPAAPRTAPATLQAFEDRIGRESTAAPAIPTRPPAAGVWVQVASLTSRSEADALAARLSKSGYRAQIAVAAGPKGRLFRVRVGPYRSEEEAGRMADRLRSRERIRQTWIVREGG